MTKQQLQQQNLQLIQEIESLKKLVPLTEDKVRSLIEDEIVKGLTVKVSKYYHGDTPTLLVEYKGNQIAYEQI